MTEPLSLPDTYRYLALVAKAAAEVGIEFETAMRFMAAVSLLMTADQNMAGKQTERTQ